MAHRQKLHFYRNVSNKSKLLLHSSEIFTSIITYKKTTVGTTIKTICSLERTAVEVDRPVDKTAFIHTHFSSRSAPVLGGCRHSTSNLIPKGKLELASQAVGKRLRDFLQARRPSA